MAALADGQWSLEYDGQTFVFGTPDDGLYLSGPPEFAAVDLTTDDQDVPRGDGRTFGEDFRRAQTITFDLESVEAVAADPHAAVLERVDTMGGAWRADSVRSTGGKVAVLRTQQGGRSRRVYGRPRRFAPSVEFAAQGVAVVLSDFACADDVFYDDALQSVVVSLVPPPGSGLLAPLATPLATALTGGSKPGSITVGGKVATWPVITIYGPITNPSVEVGDVLTMTLAATLGANDRVTIDTRPWVRSVVRKSGGSLAGALTRQSTRITQAKVPVGTHEVVLRGTDPTATASLRFEWRDAYTTL